MYIHIHIYIYTYTYKYVHIHTHYLPEYITVKAAAPAKQTTFEEEPVGGGGGAAGGKAGKWKEQSNAFRDAMKAARQYKQVGARFRPCSKDRSLWVGCDSTGNFIFI